MERYALANLATLTVYHIDNGIPLASRTKLPWQSVHGDMEAGGGTSAGFTFPWWNRRGIRRQLAFWRIISFFEASTQGRCCGHEVLLDLVRSFHRWPSRIVNTTSFLRVVAVLKEELHILNTENCSLGRLSLLCLGTEDTTSFVLASAGTSMIFSSNLGIPHGGTAARCR